VGEKVWWISIAARFGRRRHFIITISHSEAVLRELRARYVGVRRTQRNAICQTQPQQQQQQQQQLQQ